MEAFEQPLEGIFRDGIPYPILRAFAPLYLAVPHVQQAVDNARDCYFWNGNPLKCIDQDLKCVTTFMQASETSFRLCPQESASLLKCHNTEAANPLFFCRDEEWEWRACLMDKTGVRFAPYANAPRGARWSNGGQTEDFHGEDRNYYAAFSFWKKKSSAAALRERDLAAIQQRRLWSDAEDPFRTSAQPHNINKNVA